MEWIRFKDVTLSTQYGYTATETSKSEGKYKYLRITDIVPYFVNYETVPFCKIAEKQVEKYLVKEGDILVARTGATTGYNYVVPKGIVNTVYASYLIRFVVNADLCLPQYLKYVLKSKAYYGFVNNYIGGSAQPGMNARVFGKFYIPKHAIEVQHRIASILSTYDSLIENNTKRIRLLEKMAENLYKEWFVRFRFPGHENVEMENGLPKGWKIKRINDYGRIETGKTPSMQVPENYGGKYLFIKTPDMHGGVFVCSTEETLSELGNKTQPKKLLPPFSVMVSCIGSAGIVALNAKAAHTNQQINSIIPSDIANLEWLYFICKELKPTIELFGATGATMTNLSKGKFEKLKVLEPPIALRSAFHEKVTSMFKLILKLEYKNTLLARQRDLLLPRLMSGKLEV